MLIYVRLCYHVFLARLPSYNIEILLVIKSAYRHANWNVIFLC